MVRSIVARLLAAAVVWWAVVEGDPSALVYGAVAMPLAVAASIVLAPPARARGRARGVSIARRAGATVVLPAWVVWRSVLGGVDVARRAFVLPRPDVAPVWRTYRTTLSTPSARVALAFLMNLMPGTLSARVDGSVLDIHLIDRSMDVDSSLASLERRIALIAGESPTPSPPA